MPVFTKEHIDETNKNPVTRHRRIAEEADLRAHNLRRRADKEDFHEYNEGEKYPYSPKSQQRFEKVADRLGDLSAKHERMARTAGRLKVYGSGHDMSHHGEGKPHGGN